ncbi:MAG: right-handed parallel beta-helix repeat-containing protein [Thermoplasmatota archaeon]
MLTSLTIIMFLTTTVIAQCSGGPDEGYSHINEIVEMEEDLILDQHKVLNGTILVKEDLRIENSTVIMSGKGLHLSEDASLVIRNSTLNRTRESSGFYLELLGDALIYNSTITGCIDRENGFFGIYVERSTLESRNMTMVDSGMVRVSGGNALLRNSTVNGMISYSGNISVEGGAVVSSGISQVGAGDAVVRGVDISSRLPFTSTAGIYSIDADSMTIEDVNISGTYNGGISSVRTPTSVSITSIVLPNGTISMELNDLEVRRLSDIHSDGCDLGIFMSNCSSPDTISNISVRSGIRGMDIRGNDPLTLQDIEIYGGHTGMSVGAPSVILNSVFSENKVGLIIEDSSVVDLYGNTFIDYSVWGIEEESWSPVIWSNNTFNGSQKSRGSHAWWGWVPVEVTGPKDVEIKGAEVIVNGPFGSGFEVHGDRAGLIWGYRKGEKTVSEVTYEVRASWGTAEDTVLYEAAEGEVLSMDLPMTDVRIDDLRLDNGDLLVSIGCSGSKANEITLTVYVDDIEWTTFRTTLGENANKTVRLQELGLPSEKHSVNVTVSSKEEYNGASGIYLNNNKASISGHTDEGVGENNGTLLIILACLVSLSVLSFLVPIMLRRRD